MCRLCRVVCGASTVSCRVCVCVLRKASLEFCVLRLMLYAACYESGALGMWASLCWCAVLRLVSFTGRCRVASACVRVRVRVRCVRCADDWVLSF